MLISIYIKIISPYGMCGTVNLVEFFVWKVKNFTDFSYSVGHRTSNLTNQNFKRQLVLAMVLRNRNSV